MKKIILFFLLLGPLLQAQTIREQDELAVGGQVLQALKNDPLQYKSVDRAKEKFMQSIVKKRMLAEMQKVEPAQDLNRHITEISRLHIPEPGIDRDPAYVFTPKKYSSRKSYPLIVSLHGYSSWSVVQGLFLPFQKWVSGKGYILAVPSGNKDRAKRQFWNATSFCCNFDNKKINDVRYLQRLIASLKQNIIYQRSLLLVIQMEAF